MAGSSHRYLPMANLGATLTSRRYEELKLCYFWSATLLTANFSLNLQGDFLSAGSSGSAALADASGEI